MQAMNRSHYRYPTFCDAAMRLASLDPVPRTKSELARFERTFKALSRNLPDDLRGRMETIIDTVKLACSAGTEPSSRMDRIERDLHQLCRSVNG